MTNVFRKLIADGSERTRATTAGAEHGAAAGERPPAMAFQVLHRPECGSRVLEEGMKTVQENRWTEARDENGCLLDVN